MPTPRRLLLALAAGFAASGLFAQTYVGNLNGTHADSTLELVAPGSVNLPAAGWTALSGSPRIFDAGNDAIINGNGMNSAPFSVQYVATGTALVPNSTYTLSFRMGYFSTNTGGNANYSFELGTWNGVAFTSLQAVSGGPVVYSGLFSDGGGTNSTTVSLNYSTGASVSSDTIAVRWAQTNTSSGADFMGFDNVTLSYSAVPEPSTYAAIFGGVALAGAMLHRRRRPAALNRDR